MQLSPPVATTITTLLSLLLALTGCGDPQFLDKTRKDQSILNGKPVVAGDPLARRVVMIVQELDTTATEPAFFGLCSGVLIDAQTVLTAAHCVTKANTKTRVIVDPKPRDSNLRNSPNVFTINSFRIHPHYLKGLNVKYKNLQELISYTDLAVVFLNSATNLEISADYNLQLDETSGLNDIVLAGFGKTSSLKDTSAIAHSELSGQLNQAEAKISFQQMQSAYFSLDQFNGPGVCHGDSGSPVYVKNSRSDQLSLLAIAIDVFKTDASVDATRDPKGIYTTCASSGLFLNLAPHQDWITSSASQLRINFERARGQ